MSEGTDLALGALVEVRSSGLETLWRVEIELAARGFRQIWLWDHPGGLGVGGRADSWMALCGLLGKSQTDLKYGILVAPAGARTLEWYLTAAETLTSLFPERKVSLGFGAGWHAPDFQANGFLKGSLAERYEKLDRLLAEIEDSPSRSQIEVLVGGVSGDSRRLAEKYSAVWPTGTDSATAGPFSVGLRRLVVDDEPTHATIQRLTEAGVEQLVVPVPLSSMDDVLLPDLPRLDRS